MWWGKKKPSESLTPLPSLSSGLQPDLTRQQEGTRRMASKGPGVVVLTSVVAVAGIAAAGVGWYLRQEEQRARLEAEQHLASARSQNNQLQQELGDARQQIQQLDSELVRSKDQIRQVMDELSQQRESNQVLSQSVDERQQELQRLSQEFEKVNTERNALTTELTQLKDEHQRVRAQLNELETAKRDLETKVKELTSHPTVELDKVVVTGDGASTASSASSSSGSASSGSLQGQVIVVNREYDFIVMNLGRNQGLQIGQEFHVVRGEEVLGRVKVEKVYDELSAAAILPNSNKESIHEGDLVEAI